MNQKEYTLALFTSSFPYGKEESFLENEIDVLAVNFSKILIFPHNYGGRKRKLPANAEVIFINQRPSKLEKKEIFKKHWLSIVMLLLQDIVFNRGWKNEIKMQVGYLVNYYFVADQLALKIEDLNLKNALFYSYWFDHWATVLSLLKKRGIIDQYVSRIHGYDLYEERRTSKQIPFRRFQMQGVERVFSVSKAGVDYLKKKLPAYSNKIACSYLGTSDHGSSKGHTTETLELLSVSNIFPVKRVHLIVEVLKNLNISVNWTHFGDGYLMETLQSKAVELPPNVSFSFRGRVSNTELIEFLKNYHFDVFINVSVSEGLPVSMMEAISFGIPVFATNVGGTNEIVNERTGKLYAVDFKLSEMTDDLLGFKKSIYAERTFRKGVREFWKNNFDAQVNYTSFVKTLINQ